MTLLEGLLETPIWLQIWVGWLVVVNSSAVFFLRHGAARWVLAAWIGNAIFMMALAEINGFNRLLGLSHVVFWTPLLVYLYRRRAIIKVDNFVGRWLAALFASNLLSLVIDYVDVFRYLLGDRGGG
jgi:hypothetical protein